MSKINISFNNKNYSFNESVLASAFVKLKSHLSNVMNGSGETINFDGTSYNVDSTKLSNVRNNFVSHLRTISGNGSKVSVNGIEYNVDSSKIADTVTELETVFGTLESEGSGSGSSNIIWSETPTHRINCNTGEVYSGNNYVSELFPLEDGYVYEIKQPTGGAWLEYAVYDADGVFRYGNQAEIENGNKYVDGFDNNYIRLSIHPKSKELDLSTVVPVKTDRLWGSARYSADNTNGVITLGNLDNKITIQKIPVDGGSTYKFSTSGSHKWLKWLEYAEDGTYLGYKGDAETPKEFEATVSENATYIVLSMYGGEADVEDYASFFKTADSAEYPTGLIYKLAEPVTLNGTSDFIDTGVKLYDENKDFTILMEFEEDENFDANDVVMSCALTSSPWTGLDIKRSGTGSLAYCIIGTSKMSEFFTESGKTKIAIRKNGTTTMFGLNHGELESPYLTSKEIGYAQYNNSLLLGAERTAGTGVQKCFNGTIHSCVIYDNALSDEEINEFLMSDIEIPEEPITSTIVWSETADCCIDVESGVIVEGGDYVSEPISLEDGYVYEINQPTGGTWLKCAVYDSNGTYKYYRMLNEDPNGVLYIDGFNGTNIRLSINPESPDTLDLSTIVPVKTDRIWSVERYFIDHSTGVITLNERNNYITLQKIPVEGRATYKLSTSGSHQYLGWYEYAEDGSYLGYKGNVQDQKELEATVNRNAEYVILSMHGGEGNCDDYATFVKTADAPEIQTGLVYELAEPVTLNGNSDFIDTGVKLYDEDKDFEIMLEFEEGDYGDRLGTILHCMYEERPWYGATLYHLDGGNLTLVVNLSERKDTIVYDNGVTRFAIAKVGNYYCVKLMHDGLAEPQLLAEFNIGYGKVDNNLLLGAYQDTSGNKGRFWNGTISKCKVYVDDLPSDEETNAFLNGEEQILTPDFTLTEGYYDDDGSVNTAYTMHHTDYIPITDGYIVTTMQDEDGYTNDPMLRISYFDAEFNHLGYDRGFGINEANWSYTSVVKLNTSLENVAYYVVNINTDDKSLLYYAQSNPVIDIETSYWIAGYYGDDGSIVKFENMHHSSLISIKDGIVSANNDRYLRISYFDGDGNYLGYDRGFGLNVVPSDWNSASEIILNPSIAENVAYFVINANTADKSLVTLTQ